MMVDDLQAAYQFLVDRHNRGKLNLAKFGVLALGEGANLAAASGFGGFLAFVFLTTLLMQQQLGYSPMKTGLAWLLTTTVAFVFATARASARRPK